MFNLSTLFQTDYVNVATTVFTSLEYGCCGLSEEEAVEQMGEDAIDVYHKNFWPLEWTVAKRSEKDCYAKLIVRKADDKVRSKMSDVKGKSLHNCFGSCSKGVYFLRKYKQGCHHLLANGAHESRLAGEYIKK
jgi:hypothetical protein